MTETKHSILVADDDKDVLAALKLVLKKQGYQVVTVESQEEVLRALERKQFACILMDLNFSKDTTSGAEGIELMNAIRDRDDKVPIIALTGYGSVELAVEMMQLGANDFIEKPWRNSQLLKRVEQQISYFSNLKQTSLLQQENQLLKQKGQSEIIAQSSVMQSILQQLERLALSDMNILLTGENGTGKSLLASYIHQHSSRAENSFLAVNMGGISESLFESEMFGHVKGAFTDAKEERVGRFEIASEGTLFLDEIANIPFVQQAKLLRVLEEKQFERVGSAITQATNVRIISATNGDLNQMVESGTFRQDLLYRLNTVEVKIPALRERQQDILPLAESFLKRFCEKYAMPAKSFTPSAASAMLSYSWPGNIRELSHTVERALFLSQDQQIDLDTLALPASESDSNNVAMEPTIEDLEQRLIIERMQKYQNDPLQTAKSLGLSRSAYYRRLEKYQLIQNQ